ncbi:MAG: alpha/beta hydrolase [Caldilineales bacterium]
MTDTDILKLYKSEESYDLMRQFYDTNLAKFGDLVSSQFVETRFGQTHMLVAGSADAPPLIMLQGMAGSAILWHHQMADFAQHHRVYALDTVGQPGRSAPVCPSIVGDDFVWWLSDVLNGLELRRTSMIGISSGAWYILRFGIVFPNRLDRAVLLSPLRLARARFSGSRWVGNAMKRDTEDDPLEDRLTTRDFSPSSDGRRYDQRLARAMALSTRHYRLSVAMGIDPQSSRATKALTGAQVIRFFASPAPKTELQRFEPPCLVVMGEHESLYNPQKAARRAELMPHATVEIVPEAGHAAVFDRPEYINPIILDFLASAPNSNSTSEHDTLRTPVGA